MEATVEEVEATGGVMEATVEGVEATEGVMEATVEEVEATGVGGGYKLRIATEMDWHLRIAGTLEQQLKWIGTIFCVKIDKTGSNQAHCSEVEGSGSVKGTRSDNGLLS